MNETIKKQILGIRDTGLTNMFDTNMVQRLAYERNFYELVFSSRSTARNMCISSSTERHKVHNSEPEYLCRILRIISQK